MSDGTRPFAFLNGRLLPSDEAQVSIFDRGFLYGDGVFETVRIQNGRLFRWPRHLARLQAGLRLLGIQLPLDTSTLAGHAADLTAANRCVDGVLRVSVSRGVGVRGYSPRDANAPTIVMTSHPRTPSAGERGLCVITSSIRVPAGDPVTSIKSANRLHSILGRAEADAAGADEALLLNSKGEMAELTGSNVFWIDADTLCTPPIEAGALPGVAREVVFELARRLGMQLNERPSRPEVLSVAAGAFGTNVVSGPVAIASLDGRELRRSNRVMEIAKAFDAIVADDCSGDAAATDSRIAPG